MNIFQVLSQGKSSLNETGMSALLGYLLDSGKDHGLSDIFVRKFLDHLDSSVFEEVLKSNFRTEVLLEEPYQLAGKTKYIDIQLSILDKKNQEMHRIIIENKIKTSAANPKQLSDYYNAILEDDPEIQNLHIVFLTPPPSSGLTKEYENLKTTTETHTKSWMYWSNKEVSVDLVCLLREILELEAVGKVTPINDYMRHTMKAFIGYISHIMSKPKSMRTGEDIGEIIDDVLLRVDGTIHRVIRRDSTQVQVFSSDTGEKEVARHVLSSFIDENNLDIDHKKFATRTIGKKVFEWLEAHGDENENVPKMST